MNERIPVLKREKRTPARRGSKILAALLALFAAVLVILFFRSSLSKVTEIHISGLHHLSEDEVREVLGIAPGDSFFFPAAGKLSANVAALPAVKHAEVLKKFPGVVEVRIQEYPEVAMYVQSDGSLTVVLENGLSLPAKDGFLPDKPILTGWRADSDVWKELCQVLSGISADDLADVSEIKPDPSLSYPDRIRIFTRSGFEVITTVSKLKDKISYLDEIMENREPGIITMLEADTYMPYSAKSDLGTAEMPENT